MLIEAKLNQFDDLIKNANSDELIWMNGYLNGIVKSKNIIVSESVNVLSKKITLLFGTETGNSKKLSTAFASKLKQQNFQVKVIATDQYRFTDLTKEENLLVIISTHGEGEPPAAAKNFYDYLFNNDLNLNKLKYSVLALGDTAYPMFCKTGEDIDERLKKLGGFPITQIKKCDVEYEEDANKWLNDVTNNLNIYKNNTSQIITPITTVENSKKGKKIYCGKILSIVNLNDKGSNKETYHIEIEADGVEYQCGDSIGIYAENETTVVEDIIAITNVDGNKIIEFKKENYSIYELLKKKINIVYLTERLVKQYATITCNNIIETRADLLELVKKYPVKNSLQFEEILVSLNAISPRLYTISSSPKAHNNEVHIVVVKDNFKINNEQHFGLCSNYISKFKINNEQSFFIQINKRFRLPAENNDIIMVGPGTGIAAFRSFIAERDVTGATGKNWLFFGDQYFETDFLYQTEIQNWVATGVLTKVSLAFSRDQFEKIYVQHKMLENGAELFQWLKNGASFYICGTKHPMSVDVENTLLQIIKIHGNYTEDGARKYLHQLEEEGRYEKDVY